MRSAAHTERLAAEMDDHDVDIVIATGSANVFYLTGIESVSLTMRPTAGRCYAVLARDALSTPGLVAHRGEVDQILDMDPVPTVVAPFGQFFRETRPDYLLTARDQILHAASVDAPHYSTAPEALAFVVAQLHGDRPRVWLDETGLLEGDLAAIEESLAGCDIAPAAAALRRVRRVKTPEEVRRLSHAAAVTQSALDGAREAMEPGVTEAEAEREFLRALVSAGGRPGVTLVRFGRGGVEGQVRPSDRRLQPGEHVWWDVMTTVDGYWADLARVDRAWELDPDAERAYRALVSGMDAAAAGARAGARACDVWAATLSAVHAAGLKEYRRHHVGHGIGVEVYDDPMIAADVDDELESGAVISLETPYYAFGLGALHVEAPVVVRPEGGERLIATEEASR